jgi:hypothetical protein
MRVVYVCGLVVTLLVAAQAAAQEPPSMLALLRVHASLQEFHQGNVFVDEDLFVLRDGSMTGSLTENAEASCIGCGWISGIVHGFGTAPQFAALERALGANAVGSLGGNCTVPTPKAISGNYEVSWYGLERGGTTPRRNVFVFQLNAEGPPCPAAVTTIVTAIETYAFQAGAPVSGLWTPP